MSRKRPGTITVVAAGLIAALVATGAGASPIPPTPELWVMDADGSDVRSFGSGAYSTEVDWAPDGTRLVRLSGSSLVVVEVATGDETQLTQPPEYPGEVAWSPDGASILYSFSENRAHGLRVVAPDGTGKQTVLTLPEGVLVSGLDWSPDSRFASFVQGTGDGKPGRVHVLDVADRSSREVTTKDALYTDTLWSPDGNWIAFSGWRWHLRVVRPDGTGGMDLTPDFESANDPEWAPDSMEIAFSGVHGDSAEPDASFGIWLVSPVTAAPRLVIPEGATPSWSPDGTRVAYSSGGDIFTRDRMGNDPRRLTAEDLQDDVAPDWSPDGSRIAFTRTPVAIYCPGIGYPVEANVVGTDGADRLEGTSGPDVIAGRGGDDEIVGLGGGDVLCGGAGDDEVIGSEGDDWIYGEDGVDVLDSGAGDDRLDGGDGDDVIVGGEGRDLLMHLWGTGAVTVNLVLEEASGRGRDLLDGIEDVYGTRGRDVLIGDGGPNALYGSDPLGDSRGDSIAGAGGDDHIEGSGGSDELRGGRGDDHLDGDAGYRVDGRDFLRGGPGRDWCYRGERHRSCELRRG